MVKYTPKVKVGRCCPILSRQSATHRCDKRVLFLFCFVHIYSDFQWNVTDQAL